MRRLLTVALVLGAAVGVEAQISYSQGGTVDGTPHGISYQPGGYYVDATNGSDSATGLNTGVPWKTLAKVNGTSLAAGARVWFKRGEIWRETLTVPASGTATEPIIFGAYGAGAAPIISAVPVLSTQAEEPLGSKILVSGIEDETDAMTTDFTNKGTASGNTVTVTTEQARAGTKSIKVVYAGTSQTANAYKTLTAATELYVRFFFMLKPGFAMGAAANQGDIMSLWDTTASKACVRIMLNSVGSTTIPPALYVDTIKNGPSYQITSAAVAKVMPGVWHMIEVHWLQGNGTGGAQVWFNGVSVFNNFTLSNTDYTARHLSLGGFVGNHVPAAGSTLYIDDVAVSATGPLGDYVTRRAYAIDLNAQANIVLRDLDLQNPGTGYISSAGATGWTASRVHAVEALPWEAPDVADLPVPLTVVRTLSSIGGAFIAQNGDFYSMGNSNVQRSTDGGANWTTLKTFSEAGEQGKVIWIDSRGYIQACPTSTTGADAGVWTSTDNGATFTRTLDWSALGGGISVWGIDEDASGNLYVGGYTYNAALGARIYKSTDGVTWNLVYNSGAGTGLHIHQIAVDKTTGYVYATQGDAGYCTILRSVDGGANWTHMFEPSLPGMVGIFAGDGYRVIGSDAVGAWSGIVRSTDDATWTAVLSGPRWPLVNHIVQDPDTEYLYAAFGGDTATTGNNGIWRSRDAGLTWDQVVALPITAASDGATSMSNVVGGKLIVRIASGGVISAKVYDLTER